MNTTDLEQVLDAPYFDVDRFGRRLPYKLTHIDGSVFIGSLARTDRSNGTFNEICLKVWDDPSLYMNDADYFSGKMKCFKPIEISELDTWLGY